MIWETVRRVADRAGVQSHVHALMGHTRSDTTQVYLRKLNRTKAMERVRDLDWALRV